MKIIGRLYLEKKRKKIGSLSLHVAYAPVITWNVVFNNAGLEDVTMQHLKKTPSPGKFPRSGNIGSKSAEFVEGSDFIVTLTHSKGQHSSLHLRGSRAVFK